MWIVFFLVPELLGILISVLGAVTVGLNVAMLITKHPIITIVIYLAIILVVILLAFGSSHASSEDQMLAVTMAICSVVPFYFGMTEVAKYCASGGINNVLSLFVFFPIGMGVLLAIETGIALFAASFHEYPIRAVVVCVVCNLILLACFAGYLL